MTESNETRVSPFGTWAGRDPFRIFPGVAIHSIGGDQVLLCRVTYDPGTTVRRHAHEHTEQLMAITDGSVEMTIGDETRTLVAGDVCVINRGVEHELYSENGAHLLRGARAGAARPRRGPRPRPRPRSRRRERPCRALAR